MINPRSIAALGLGSEPIAIATLGLYSADGVAFIEWTIVEAIHTIAYREEKKVTLSCMAPDR
jgi:hypothetical protein